MDPHKDSQLIFKKNFFHFFILQKHQGKGKTLSRWDWNNWIVMWKKQTSTPTSHCTQKLSLNDQGIYI